VHLTRLFQLLSERKFAEAERILEHIIDRMKRSGLQDFNRGYLEALGGIFLTYRSSGESYEFFSNLEISDVEALKRHYVDFKQNSKNPFHADYDRGYFSALADYMRVVLRMTKDRTESEPNGG